MKLLDYSELVVATTTLNQFEQQVKPINFTQDFNYQHCQETRWMLAALC